MKLWKVQRKTIQNTTHYHSIGATSTEAIERIRKQEKEDPKVRWTAVESVFGFEYAGSVGGGR